LCVGLGWVRFSRLGLVGWIGSGGFSLVRFSLVRFSLVGFSLVRFSLVRFSLVRFSRLGLVGWV
jgi:hypothetical protein